VLKNILHVYNASSKTGMPLPDCFIKDNLVKIVQIFNQTPLQLGDIVNLVAVHSLLQLPIDLVVYWVEVRTVGWPESWSDEVWCFMG